MVRPGATEADTTSNTLQNNGFYAATPSGSPAVLA